MKKSCKMWNSAGKWLLLFALSLCILVQQSATAQAMSVNNELWIGGNKVNSMNAGSITGTNITGTVSYNPGTNTLTLNNATITANTVSGRGNNDTIGIYKNANEGGLIIELIGTNTIVGTTSSESSYGIYVSGGNLVFTGNGSLQVSSADSSGSGYLWSVGIYSAGDVTVNSGCTIEASCGTASNIAAPIYGNLNLNGTIVSDARDKNYNNVVNPGITESELKSYSYMKLEPDTPSIGTATYGIVLSTADAYFYSDVGSANLTAETVTITNTGNVGTGDLTLELVGSHADRFTLSKSSIASIATGGSDTFDIVPKEGSAVGSYNDAAVSIKNTANNIQEHVSIHYVVFPTVPAITATLSDATYVKGETAEPLVVSATVEGNGTLTYQWVISDGGEASVVINGATSQSFVPPTDTVGTNIYCCHVTNTENGVAIFKESQKVTITVIEGSGNTQSGESMPDTSGSSNYAPADTASDNGNSTPSYVTYTVQRGDTLSAIAKRYGCSVSDVMAANRNLIKKPNLIYAGWQINIPQNGTTGASGKTSDAILPDGKKTTVYTVKQGDSLWSIARKHGCTMAEIVALNSELIRSPKLIYAGWKINIPQK